LDNDGEILLDITTNQYLKIEWIFKNNKNIDAESYAHLFAKIIGQNNDESRMRGKSMDEIASIINFMHPLLELIPDRSLTDQPQTLDGLIVNDRKIVRPEYSNQGNWWNQPSWFTQQNFIDECITRNNYIQEISNFLINIYRITDNKTSIKTELSKFLRIYSLNTQFMKLVEKGFTLQPILSLIFDSINNYDNEESVKLISHCFIYGSREITTEKAKTKLNDLLTYAQTNNSGEVFALLETLSTQEVYRNLLTNLIIEKDSRFINSLPPQFLKLAVNSFTKDSYNNYAENFEFLSVIIQKGNITQKGYVVKIITAKLDANQDIQHVLDLIDTMENIPSFDKSGLLFSHLDNYQHQNKETISTELDDRIVKLKKKLK
jgi:hypothetical protein